MIGAKLFAENEKAYWFSCNYLNVVPMHRAFNYPFFHHKVERPFLKFAQEVTRAGDSVCLIVSVSPNTRYDEQTRQCQCIPTRDRQWLRNNGLKINIPQSVSVIAFSLSERGGVREVFAFVGNNDDFSPKYCFPQDMSALQNCYSRDGDPTLRQIIKHLKSAEYNMWPGHGIHRRIPRPIYRSTLDRPSVEYQQQLDCQYIGQYIGRLPTEYWSTQQQQQIDGPILPPIHRSIDDRWTVDGLSVEYQQQQQRDGPMLPPIHRSIDDRWTVERRSVDYQQQQIDGPILPPIHRSIDDRWTVDRLSVEYQQQQQQQQIDWQIHPPTHRRLSTDFRSTINNNNNNNNK